MLGLIGELARRTNDFTALKYTELAQSKSVPRLKSVTVLGNFVELPNLSESGKFGKVDRGTRLDETLQNCV